MRNSVVTPLTQAIGSLRAAWEALVSPDSGVGLCRVSVKDATDLRQAILRVLAFLDDSISNPRLGSIFDRTGVDPLNAMLANIAAAYDVDETIAGTTGTTGLNVPAVMTLAHEGQRIAVGRDCHVSVIGGLCLSGAEPVYLVPPFDVDAGVLLPPSRADVARLLDAHPDLRAIVLTMPTYHGLMGDVAGIVDECHARGVLVMVDGAHGPHFHFLRSLGFPRPAEDAGADLVTQSTHKVLSALNQASLLHFNNAALVPRYEECQALGFQSTSFSYPILLSIEHAIGQMVTDGVVRWAGVVEQARRLRRGASRIRGLRVLDEGILDRERVVGLDPTRVTLNVRGTGVNGYEIADRLHRDYGLLVEMATPDVVLFLLSPSVTAAMVDATIEALADVLGDAPSTECPGDVFVPPTLPARVLTPRQALLAPRERVPRAQALGRVSGETIGCYPPGQAVFVAGERITHEGVDYLTRAVEAGGHLKRVQDDHFQTIDVVREMN